MTMLHHTCMRSKGLQSIILSMWTKENLNGTLAVNSHYELLVQIIYNSVALEGRSNSAIYSKVHYIVHSFIRIMVMIST